MLFKGKDTHSERIIHICCLCIPTSWFELDLRNNVPTPGNLLALVQMECRTARPLLFRTSLKFYNIQLRPVSLLKLDKRHVPLIDCSLPPLFLRLVMRPKLYSTRIRFLCVLNVAHNNNHKIPNISYFSTTPRRLVVNKFTVVGNVMFLDALLQKLLEHRKGGFV